MTCEGDVCGTGGWDGPKPGDPDNNVALRANAVYGGIDVSFTYPTINPHAVAHTLLFRGVTEDFAQAAQRAVMTGSIFYDKIDVGVNTDYYYWIQIVSVNGTVMDPVGPASATAIPRPIQTLESLTGMIDNGVLSQDLKSDISGIITTNGRLSQEVLDRLNANQAFADAMAQINDGLAQAVTVISTETKQRTDGDNALAQSISVIASANQNALAAIEEEKTTRVSSEAAFSQKLDTVVATLGDTTSGVIHDVSTLATKTDSMATDLTTAESTLNGNTATGQVGLITKVGDHADTLTKISAEYFAKVEVNGLIGGFGILNDGASVEAGFDVDRFWVGRSSGVGTNAVKPFIVDQDTVYIDKARIRNADIDSLKLAGSAVTVPIAVRTSNILSGTGLNNWQTLIAGYIKLDIPGIVYAHCICFQSYGQGVRKWQMDISINGVTGSSIGGQSVLDTPVIAQSIACPAGVIPVIVRWSGENNGIRINRADLFIIGAKR